MTDNKVAALAASIDHSIGPERRRRLAGYQLAALREIGWDLVQVKLDARDHPFTQLGSERCCDAPRAAHQDYRAS